MKLYYHPFSRASRVRWLLEELGVPYDLIRMDLDADDPAYRQVHPLGLVPALEDGGRHLFESAAILMQLADKYPEKMLAPPVGTHERGLYYQWILFAMTQVEPAVVEFYAQTQATEEKDRVEKNLEWAKASFAEAAGVLERELAGKEFIVGNRLSAADVCLCSLLAWAMMLKLLEPYPNLLKYVKNLGSRPANRKARAD